LVHKDFRLQLSDAALHAYRLERLPEVGPELRQGPSILTPLGQVPRFRQCREDETLRLVAVEDTARAPGAHETVEHGPRKRDVEGTLVASFGRGNVEDAARD
jgi:hypothetical protein